MRFLSPSGGSTRYSILTFVVVENQGSSVFGNVGMDGVSLKLFVATFFLSAEFFQDGPLAFASLEVARVPGQLDPLVLAVLERLDEGSPLDHVPHFSPS